jgi:hypothetical protein
MFRTRIFAELRGLKANPRPISLLDYSSSFTLPPNLPYSYLASGHS